MKKIIILLLLMSFVIQGQSQTSINNYKYVVVPLQFEFLKGKDQYRVNTLTRFLLKQEGFEVYFDEEKLPDDLSNNRCLALYANVKKVRGGLLKTKVEILLKDCYGNLILKSRVGQSKEKKFDKAYSAAIRDAFESIKDVNYKYDPKAEIETSKNEVIALKNNEVEILKAEDNKSNEVKDEIKKDETLKSPEKIKVSEENTKIYYAQAIDNGFQLVNSEPKIVMILLNTAAKDVFIVKGKSAIVFKEDEFWYYSENNGKLSEKNQLNIKF